MSGGSPGFLVKDLIGSIVKPGWSKEEFAPLITTPQVPGFTLNTGVFPSTVPVALHRGNLAEAAVSFCLCHHPSTSQNTAQSKTPVFTLL